jgi:prepilin-type N-terminal cleavage/methylation domain-containing protein
MKTDRNNRRLKLHRVQPHLLAAAKAFTLVEVMVGMGVVAILFVSLYAGISAGFGVTQLARENLRATQIMLDRMEEMRLYTWEEISSFGSSNSYVPSNFTVPFYPSTTNYAESDLTVCSQPTNPAGGFLYCGTLDVADAGFSNCSYSNDVKRVTVTVTWTNGVAVRQRTMSTLVCQYGMQNYLY